SRYATVMSSSGTSGVPCQAMRKTSARRSPFICARSCRLPDRFQRWRPDARDDDYPLSNLHSVGGDVSLPERHVRFGSFTTDALEATRSCMSALPPKADIASLLRNVCFVPEAAVSNRSKTVALFDHLVGAGEHLSTSRNYQSAHLLLSARLLTLELGRSRRGES